MGSHAFIYILHVRTTFFGRVVIPVAMLVAMFALSSRSVNNKGTLGKSKITPRESEIEPWKLKSETANLKATYSP